MQKEANYLLLSCEDVKQVSSANANIIFWLWRWLPHRSSKRQSLYVNNNNPIQDYVHPDDRTQPTFDNIFSDFAAIG